MQHNTYLGFDGDCEAAFRFYEKVLGGKIVMMARYRDMPGAEQSPAAMQDKIMHARLMLGDRPLMGGDAPDSRFSKPQGFCVNIAVTDPGEAERVFKDLAEGGTIKMPIGETFWAHRFGMLIDKFGTPWMVNCEKPM